MTGISANCNSVSSPKTAVSCGLTLSAAIRRVMKSGDNPRRSGPRTQGGTLRHKIGLSVLYLIIYNKAKSPSR